LAATNEVKSMHPYQPDPAARKIATERSGRTWIYDALHGPSIALIVVDMQNYFCEPGSQGETPVARQIIPTINQAAQAVRAAGGLVVWVQTASTDAQRLWGNFHRTMLSPERKARRLAGLAETGEGFQLAPGLEPADSDTRVTKTTYSAFGPATPNLDGLLKRSGIDTVLIAGTLTNVCCETTARDAVVHDYNTIMLSDANASRADEDHANTLNNFQIYFGEVMTVEQTIARLQVTLQGAA
jgi:ureidoacrylate peracid hydrolase